MLDAVAEDPDLGADEKETLVTVEPDEPRLRVYSERRGMMRRLLLHPHGTTVGLRVSDESRVGVGVDPEDYESGHVVGVGVRLPLGVLSIKSSPRSDDSLSSVVSHRVLDHDPRKEGDDAE